MPRLSLNQRKIRRRNPRLQMRWERGAISPPRDPHEPNVGLVIFYCVFDGLPGVCIASVPKRPCGVRTSHHVVYGGFPRISGVQRRCAARTCRIRSARLLAALSRHCAAFYDGAGTRLRYRHSGANAPRPRFSFFSREKKENKKSEQLVGESPSPGHHIE